MKKLLAILGVITCMFGLCACGQEETTQTNYNEDDLIAGCVEMLNRIDLNVAQGASNIESYSDMPAVYNALLSWQSALPDIGTYDGTNGGTVTASEDEIIVEVNVLGSKHNAVVEFIIDSKTASYLSITTNVTYSFGELMVKAFLNTVIGMGTVFVVLIFISLIISSFGLISKVGDKKKAEPKATQSAVAADPVVEQIAQKEELAGDAELVAVIAAAIAAYEGSGSTDGFVVRSIRKSNKSKWQNA
ncbi:MAG: OadG family protein [Lachnospiraceae bacterium]|nr:OadG family protein [Lachnospiraceae bacterium]